jgi:hypothetical protein
MSHSKSPYKVTITDTPTPVVDPGTPAGVKVRGRILRNLGSSTIYLGGPDVEANTDHGWELAAGEEFPDTISNGALWAIVAAAGSEPLQVWEVIQ